MYRQVDIRFRTGRINYTVTLILLTFLGLLGIHRMYIGKWVKGIIYPLTVDIVGIGYPYDLWTLNDQITMINGSY